MPFTTLHFAYKFR